MKFSDNLAKVLFVFSLVTFVLMYGVVAGNYGWFPRGFLDQALEQARDVYSAFFGPPPHTLPQVYDRSGVRTEKPEQVQPGMTLITSLWDWDNSGDLEAGAELINQKGETVHRWQVDRSKLFPDLDVSPGNPHGSYLFSDGNLMLNMDGRGTVLLDSCGKILWQLQKFNHHSIARAEDGTFWIPGEYKDTKIGTENYPNGFPGLGSQAVQVKRILHVTEDGKILKDINVLDVLYKNGLERYFPKTTWSGRGLGEVIPDITHLNDVEPLNPVMAEEYPLFDAGDLLVSLRTPSLVFVFDPETMEVKWHASEPFNHQHDADFIGNGWIGVFDNNSDPTGRGQMLGGSRIVAIKPHTNTVEIRFPTPHSAPLYTLHHGKWQILDNGNMLLTEAVAGRVVEVTPDGRTVWEWIHKPVGDSRVPLVTEGTRYNLTKEEVISWPCSLENTEQEGG